MHPDSLTCANNLAGLLYCMGEYVEAEFLFREVLNGRRIQLGDRHPDTVQTANQLAAAQQAQHILVVEREHQPASATESWQFRSPCSLCCLQGPPLGSQ